MKKIFKITIILMILMIGFGELTIVRADPAGLDDYLQEYLQGEAGVGDLNHWDPEPIEPNHTFDTEVGIILGVIRSVGIIISVGALVVIGIKEMTGSIEEKSNIKKAMPGYILGIGLIAGMTIVPSIIYNMIKDW